MLTRLATPLLFCKQDGPVDRFQDAFSKRMSQVASTGYRRYHRTHSKMISAWKWRHLNGVVVSMKLVPLASQNTVEFTSSLTFSQHSLCEQLPHRTAGLRRVRRTRHFQRAS